MLNVRFVNPSKPFEFNICKKPVKEVSYKMWIRWFLCTAHTVFQWRQKEQESCAIEYFSVNIISNQFSIVWVEETNQEELRFIFLKDMGSEM